MDVQCQRLEFGFRPQHEFRINFFCFFFVHFCWFQLHKIDALGNGTNAMHHTHTLITFRCFGIHDGIENMFSCRCCSSWKSKSIKPIDQCWRWAKCRKPRYSTSNVISLRNVEFHFFFFVVVVVVIICWQYWHFHRCKISILASMSGIGWQRAMWAHRRMARMNSFSQRLIFTQVIWHAMLYVNWVMALPSATSSSVNWRLVFHFSSNCIISNVGTMGTISAIGTPDICCLSSAASKVIYTKEIQFNCKLNHCSPR